MIYVSVLRHWVDDTDDPVALPDSFAVGVGGAREQLAVPQLVLDRWALGHDADTRWGTMVI